MIIDKDYTRKFRIFGGAVLSLIVTLSVMIDSGYLRFLDSLMIGAIQKSNGGFKDALMHLSTTLASPKFDIIYVLILAFFMWGFKFKLQALWAIFTIIGGDIVGFVFKEIVRRARPTLHSAADTGFSFPSGHVLGIFIVISIIWIIIIPAMKSDRWRIAIQILSVIFLLMVMMSRVYLNAHYPTDTIGAVLIAYTWVQISEIFYVKYAPRLKQNWRPVLHSYL